MGLMELRFCRFQLQKGSSKKTAGVEVSSDQKSVLEKLQQENVSLSSDRTALIAIVKKLKSQAYQAIVFISVANGQ